MGKLRLAYENCFSLMIFTLYSHYINGIGEEHLSAEAHSVALVGHRLSQSYSA